MIHLFLLIAFSDPSYPYEVSLNEIYYRWKISAVQWNINKDYIKEITLPLNLTKDNFPDLLILQEGKIWKKFKPYMACSFKINVIVDGKTNEVLFFFDGELAPIFFAKTYGANCWKCVGPGMEDWVSVNFKVLWPTFSHFLKDEQQRLKKLAEKIKTRKAKETILKELDFKIYSSKWNEAKYIVHKLKKIKAKILNHLKVTPVIYHSGINIAVGKGGFTIDSGGLTVFDKSKGKLGKSFVYPEAKNKIQWLEWKDAWPFGGLIYIDHFEWKPEKGAFYGYTDVP